MPSAFGIKIKKRFYESKTLIISTFAKQNLTHLLLLSIEKRAVPKMKYFGLEQLSNNGIFADTIASLLYFYETL
jgi:hypothetical protein